MGFVIRAVIVLRCSAFDPGFAGAKARQRRQRQAAQDQQNPRQYEQEFSPFNSLLNDIVYRMNETVQSHPPII